MSLAQERFQGCWISRRKTKWSTLGIGESKSVYEDVRKVADTILQVNSRFWSTGVHSSFSLADVSQLTRCRADGQTHLRASQMVTTTRLPSNPPLRPRVQASEVTHLRPSHRTPNIIHLRCHHRRTHIGLTILHTASRHHCRCIRIQEWIAVRPSLQHHTFTVPPKPRFRPQLHENRSLFFANQAGAWIGREARRNILYRPLRHLTKVHHSHRQAASRSNNIILIHIPPPMRPLRISIPIRASKHRTISPFLFSTPNFQPHIPTTRPTSLHAPRQAMKHLIIPTPTL